MVQLSITHPGPVTPLISRKIYFIVLTEVSFMQMWISPPPTHRFFVYSLIDARLTSNPPCPTPALVSNIYNFFISNPFPQVPFPFITYHYHLRRNSPHTRTTFLFHVCYSNAVTTFEINPYPQQNHFQVHYATAQQQKHIDILVRFL